MRQIRTVKPRVRVPVPTGQHHQRQHHHRQQRRLFSFVPPLLLALPLLILWQQASLSVDYYRRQTTEVLKTTTTTMMMMMTTATTRTYFGVERPSRTTLAQQENEEQGQARCALLFFGLPRAFQVMVLPSIIRNILIPNARHNCDVFVHFYDQKEEPEGRLNYGGRLDTAQIYQLEAAVLDVHRQYYHDDTKNDISPPRVVFVNDTQDSFWKVRGEDVHKYQTARDANGTLIYFPFKARTYHVSSIENIVKQWHSIDRVYRLMNETEATTTTITQQQSPLFPPPPPHHHLIRPYYYSRIGMFRSDVLYVTPINIALLEGPGLTNNYKNNNKNNNDSTGVESIHDRYNEYVVQPGFAQMPVNDRMIYGPRAPVEIWATRRFDALEERARYQPSPGYVMHSESFLNDSIFPMMVRHQQQQRQQRIITNNHHDDHHPNNDTIVSNPDICFLRVRADESVMVDDCTMGIGGGGSGGGGGGVIQTRDWNQVNIPALVEDMVGRNCTRYRIGRRNFLGCGGGGGSGGSRQEEE